MTDIDVGGLVLRESLQADDTTVKLRVGLVIRESLVKDIIPPTDLNVGMVLREILTKDATPPTDLNVAQVNREALLGPPLPSPEFILENLNVTYHKPLLDDQAFITLRFSDNGGWNWKEPRTQPLGRLGEFHTNVQFRNLGEGRNKLIEVSWSAPSKAALGGATIHVLVAGS